MATVSQTFRALIEADSKGAVKNLEKFNGEVEKATVGGAKKTDQLGAAFKRMGGIVAGLGVAKVLQDSIGAASDLEESVNAVRVTFGDAADAVLALSENSARSVGLAKSDFNSLSVSFAAFATDIAGDGGDVAGVIDDLTRRSADFASVMNLDVTDAARVFSSTLAGESEPIKRFGIVIDDAAVKAKALELGLADTTAEVTAQDKVLARYELLMEETEKTAGDFANTSDSLANKQRILKADLKNTSAELGESLLPAAEAAVTAIGAFVDVLNEIKVPEALEHIGVALKGLVGDSGAGKDAIAEVLGVSEAEDGARRLVLLSEAVDDVLGRKNALEKFGDTWAIGFGADASDIRRGALRETLEEIGQTDPGAMQDIARDIYNIVLAAESGNVAAQAFADKFGLSMDIVNEGLVTAQASADAFDMMDLQTAMAQSSQSAEDLGVESVMASEALRDQARASNNAADVLLALEDRQQLAAEATERHREAIKDLFDEINNNLSSMFDYEEATLDVENAIKDFADAAVEALEVANDSEASAADREQALRDMRQAEIDAANSALDAATAYAESQGAIEGTTTFAMLQREELERLKDRFPELTDEIAQFIDELNRIPAVKTVSLVVARNGVNANLASVGATARADENLNLRPGFAGASGAIVTRPTLALIGEAGPEALVPLSGAPGASRLPGGVGGGNVYNINVTAPAGADADEFGRIVREAIRRETRWSGPVTGWSAA